MDRSIKAEKIKPSGASGGKFWVGRKLLRLLEMLFFFFRTKVNIQRSKPTPKKKIRNQLNEHLDWSILWWFMVNLFYVLCALALMPAWVWPNQHGSRVCLFLPRGAQLLPQLWPMKVLCRSSSPSNGIFRHSKLSSNKWPWWCRHRCLSRKASPYPKWRACQSPASWASQSPREFPTKRKVAVFKTPDPNIIVIIQLISFYIPIAYSDSWYFR